MVIIGHIEVIIKHIEVIIKHTMVTIKHIVVFMIKDIQVDPMGPIVDFHLVRDT